MTALPAAGSMAAVVPYARSFGLVKKETCYYPIDSLLNDKPSNMARIVELRF